MQDDPLSLIFLPTLRCNAACDYCFENKTNVSLALDQLSTILNKVFDYLDEKQIASLNIYWQGGEIMTLSPSWVLRAGDLITDTGLARGKEVNHFLQSNMIGYGKEWNGVISSLFANVVGTSLDYPNLYRRAAGLKAEEFNELWRARVREARESGIEVEVIALPNAETLKRGAEEFYSYFVEDLQIYSFQLNTPFPGGKLTGSKQQFPLKMDGLKSFFMDLAELWIKDGYPRGVRIGPLDQLINYFLHEPCVIPCIWLPNCADEFLCIDARGFVAQCDCWVCSYPRFRFGNVFESGSLARLLEESESRRIFRGRPSWLMRSEDCAVCEFLALCHGGCPVRAYTFRGDLFRKDPYCELYKSLFHMAQEKAATLAGRRRAPKGQGRDGGA